MANKISIFDLKRILNGWEGKFQLIKQSGIILHVVMIYTIDKIGNMATAFQFVDDLEEEYGHPILYEFDTASNSMKIKMRVTPQNISDFLRIKHLLKKQELKKVVS